jgi:hypothetical protein
MKIGVIIPDRNDRPRLLENCMRMIKAQTIHPDIIELVNDEPKHKGIPDITWRYRTGYERLRNKGLDVIFLMENDDYYAPSYIETMLAEWNDAGRPQLFGPDFTIYYHIKLFHYFIFNHKIRSSAMSTMIKPDLNFDWCPDHEVYTDMHLWTKTNLSKQTFHPTKIICAGIKHGDGFCGGRMHTTRLDRYTKNGINDSDKSFIRMFMNKESFNFYTNYFSNGSI